MLRPILFWAVVLIATAILFFLSRRAAARQRLLLADEALRIGETPPALRAGFWIRFAARLVDILIVNLALTVILAVLFAARVDTARVGVEQLTGIFVLFWLVILFFYLALTTGASGQTLGKELAGIVVLHRQGGKLGWGRAFFRSLVDTIFNYLLLFGIGVIDPLLIFFKKERRSIHDYAAGSIVQSTAAPSRWLPFIAALYFVLPLMLLFLIVNPFIGQAYFTPSSAMEPTVRMGEKMLVNKLVYKFHPVKHGDLILFRTPPAGLMDNTQYDSFKRVIALPGDTIQVKAGEGVFVNGNKLDEPYAPKPEYAWPLDDMGMPLHKPLTVPKGTCFVLGDNRNNSNDSHYWADRDTGKPAPWLPISYIKGKVVLILE